jgi:hypothetical protein
VLRATDPTEAAEAVEAAAAMAFLGGTAMAVLLSQRLVGTKDFTR